MAEALRAFSLASQEDPGAAMPYWGQALALGPFINRCCRQALPYHNTMS